MMTSLLCNRDKERGRTELNNNKPLILDYNTDYQTLEEGDRWGQR